MSRTQWNQKWLKIAGQNHADLLLCTTFSDIRDDLLPGRWKRNVSPGRCVCIFVILKFCSFERSTISCQLGLYNSNHQLPDFQQTI